MFSLCRTGLDDASYDPQRFAMDYHIIGFRECVAEVARYLVTIEGMDVQDPLRLRLMSHLQCFATQRELSSKANAASATSPAWSHGSTTAYPVAAAAVAYPSTHHGTSGYYHPHQNYGPHQSATAPYIPQQAGAGSANNGAPTYTELSNHNPNRGLSAYGNPQYPVSTSTHGYNTAAKPYRPWGAEMAC
ncbi:bHLH protein Hesr-1/Hey1 [Anopheles sinensis]|uniref:BHLH protein Hesr-1/Hey1 n=1 Tax=Anopheles sinensis TaxID=74873 RepID=A0A084WN81_ANOSI|nr:bHLH protein Hesr-1/Hey1 [Anopheles sinensis]